MRCSGSGGVRAVHERFPGESSTQVRKAGGAGEKAGPHRRRAEALLEQLLRAGAGVGALLLALVGALAALLLAGGRLRGGAASDRSLTTAETAAGLGHVDLHLLAGDEPLGDQLPTTVVQLVIHRLAHASAERTTGAKLAGR